MIHITGDTHGRIDRFVLNRMNDADWGENDILIICGDFGFIYSNNLVEQDYLDFLAKKPYTICFCDGNHENFPVIEGYPKKKWKGGYTHRIRGNIYHLMRGEVFEIEGKKIFTMGGGYSIDVGQPWREPGRGYWEEEMPSDDEYRNAEQTLREHDNKVDIIITHTAPKSVIIELKRIRQHIKEINSNEDMLTGFFDILKEKVEFKHWYFGHWHADARLGERFTATYRDVYTVDF